MKMFGVRCSVFGVDPRALFNTVQSTPRTSLRVRPIGTCLLLLIVAAPMCAQGTITGKLKDAAGTTTWFAEPVAVGALVLPDDSHPFNEMCAGAWQDAMTALQEGRTPETPLGGLLEGVTPESSQFVNADADGGFRINDLPLQRRIALAARIGELWWPLDRECWVTESAPSVEVEIPFFTMNSAAAPKLLTHSFETDTAFSGDLKYASIAIRETLRLENPDPGRAVLAEIRLDIMMPPNILARHLPSLYGSQWLLMQGTDSLPASSGDRSVPLARQAWRFGGADAMHSVKAVYNKGPQHSNDNWHPLNEQQPLHMLAAGETLFVENATPSGRSASLIFRRPVPPALNGKPGTLVLRVLHSAGVPMNEPAAKIVIKRSFPYTLESAEAQTGNDIVLQALVADGHRRLYGEAQPGEIIRYAAATTPALEGGQQVELLIGLSDQAQARLAELAGMPPEAAQGRTDAASMRWNVVFQVLAVVFGLAFVGALVASIRWPKEKQLERLAALPATRPEVLAAIKGLEEDYQEGKLPAREYVDQRQRLINRLVEFDAKQ
jgi:hypothetical protein